MSEGGGHMRRRDRAWILGELVREAVAETCWNCGARGLVIERMMDLTRTAIAAEMVCAVCGEYTSKITGWPS